MFTSSKSSVPAVLATLMLALSGCAQFDAGPQGSVGKASSLGAEGSSNRGNRVFLNDQMAPMYAQTSAGPQGSVGSRSSQGAAGSNGKAPRVYTSDEMAP